MRLMPQAPFPCAVSFAPVKRYLEGAMALYDNPKDVVRRQGPLALDSPATAGDDALLHMASAGRGSLPIDAVRSRRPAGCWWWGGEWLRFCTRVFVPVFPF